MKRVVLVFDADDTLWMNEWQYSQAYADFFSWLYETFEGKMPNLHAVKARFDEIDRALYATRGIKRGRVAEAMLETYHDVLAYIKKKYGARGLPPASHIREHETRIKEIGDQPFAFYKLRWLPVAQRTLKELRDKGYSLRLLTSYDEEVWKEKSRLLGVERYFENIRVIPAKKTAEDFIAVSEYRAGEKDARYYAIGNGTSDILPALEISDAWQGIYLPHGSTSAFFADEKSGDVFTPPPIEHPRVVTLSSLGQLRCFDFARFRFRHDINTPCEKCALPGV